MPCGDGKEIGESNGHAFIIPLFLEELGRILVIQYSVWRDEEDLCGAFLR